MGRSGDKGGKGGVERREEWSEIMSGGKEGVEIMEEWMELRSGEKEGVGRRDE